MAVAGLNNVSVLDSPFFGESQSLESTRWDNQDRPSTQASSLLQMWRELEGEHAMNYKTQQQKGEASNSDFAGTYVCGGQRHGNGDTLKDASEVESERHVSSQDGYQDDRNCSSKQSNDFGEVERERVRQIFREWKKNGSSAHASNASRFNKWSGAQWLGEHECERVRIVREWVEMTTGQQRATGQSDSEERNCEIGLQIERVRDGLVVSHCQTGSLRAIRRLCGRQALLDLLARAERERERELQDLLEQRPVSNFAHRNRIQSYLRGRFLQNGGLVQDKSSTSLAASELGFLRQRPTVSGLREGFLSRFDNFVPGSLGSNHYDSSTDNKIDDHRNKQAQSNSIQEVPDELWHADPSNCEKDRSLLDRNDLESDTWGLINLQEPTSQVEEIQERLSEIDERVQLPLNIEPIERKDDNGNDVVRNWRQGHGNEWSRGTSGPEAVCYEHHEPSGEPRDVHDTSGPNDRLEGTKIWQGISASQVEISQEPNTEIGKNNWQQLAGVESSEWGDGTGEDMDGNSHVSSYSWYPETSASDDRGYILLQEAREELHGSGLQETARDFSGPSGQVEAPAGRADTFHFTDDENACSLEIRELLSRRRVSNLLHSGFRESLDQIIQSYLERQGHASVEWDLDQEQQIEDQNVVESDIVVSNPQVLCSLPITRLPTLWELDSDNEWEIINDLRNDMSELQQRMNKMHRMLEACMDMQLELQCTVQQEFL
ncbi:hypothetical protein RJ639_044600 [Escallonia herrerae]|uniref:Uncharacterized protein n=1 Tax=Escallonia herrerae TaxID=1293975 RepID=A0AA88WB90_9ASTE|nr:hypothetical protein RJ639_044600 [Escallonia herrerae]